VNLLFHSDAAANFANKASKLLERLNTPTETAPQVEHDDFPIDPHVKARIGAEDIIEIGPWGRLDLSGKEIARYFQRGDKTVGLEGEDYQELRKLAEQMQTTATLRDTVSVDTVVDFLVDWLKLPVREKAPPAPDYVLQECKSAIADRTILIPVHELYVEGPIDMGRVTIKPIDRVTLDEWIGQAVGEVTDEHLVETSVSRWRTEMQGKAAVEKRVIAERRRAVEIARRDAASALALLALFHPAMFHPRVRSNSVLLGSEHVESAVHLVLREGRYELKQNYILPPFPIPWKLSNETILKYRQVGLDKAAALLRSDTPSPFQKKLLEALLFFSRSGLTSDLSERILYIIVALETLLLRDRSESLQQNIAERVAFLVARNPKDRLQVVADVKAGYHFRSEFVHHGASMDELGTLQKVMDHAWNFLNIALRNSDGFKTQDDLFDFIDHLKFS